MRHALFAAVLSLIAVSAPSAQAPFQPDFAALETETLRHFQALVRMDTSDPPGVEKPAADYVKQVLEAEGIPVQLVGRRPEPPERRGTAQGIGPEAAAADRRPPRHRQRGPEEVAARPVQRRRATAATSTGAARWTTRTTSPPR